MVFSTLRDIEVYMDFTSLDVDIKEDLSERDFTINAIAWSLKTGLIDLHSGVEDIKKGLITAI
jgi:tRNA nucleotidyltransferase/poly(A) polymerase